MMTLLDERPTGKLIVAYRQGYIDSIDEFNGETKRLITLDAKVCYFFVLFEALCFIIGGLFVRISW